MPPVAGNRGDMTFLQSDKTVGTVRVQAEGPAWVSVEPSGPQARELISSLTADPLTIRVAAREHKIDLAGLAGAVAQLSECEVRARQ